MILLHPGQFFLQIPNFLFEFFDHFSSDLAIMTHWPESSKIRILLAFRMRYKVGYGEYIERRMKIQGQILAS